MKKRPSGELLHHLLLFARRLKGKGFKITTGRVIDAARSLPYLDLSRREDFAAALRAHWASSPGEISVFDDLFRVFWSQFERRERKPVLPSGPEPGSVENGGEKLPFLFPGETASPEPEGPGRVGTGLRYSPEERLMAKDFTRLTAEETPRFARALQRLLSRWAARISRRRRPSGRGREIDFRRTLRTAVGHGGEMVKLIRKRARVKPLKMITICDVSGSMDSSTRFTLQFIHGMQRIFRRSETFVFSTRLTRISDLLKRNRWPVALKAIGERVQDWSGGTRIGPCLKVFNERYGKGLAAGSFLLVIISDGWDRGDALTLETEMKRLKRRARRIVWMNPLLETPGYQSLCLGMRTALPFIDHFIPANSLENFQDLGEIFIPRGG